MMVGGGAVPATSLTRHEVHRPRPPQVAVMSTPEAWADFRIVVPGVVSRTWRAGRMVSGIAIPGAGYHFFLDFPRGFANSSLLTRQRARRALLRGVWLARYVVYRLLWLVPTLMAMALVTFLVMHATPGSPLDPIAGCANPLSPEAQSNLAAHYGLDRPLWEQFAIFVAKAVQGDFGSSFVYRSRTVAEIIGEVLPVSLMLGAMAMAVAVAGGLALGVVAAVHQNRTWDYVSVSVATAGVAVPNFVLAVFLIVLFSLLVPLFPTGGWDSPRAWVLPTLTLALGPLGIVARFTRAAVLDVIRSDFTLTARAKGLSETPVIFKHVLKNALIPVVTVLGPMFAAIGTGSFFVESIFRVPGLGRFFVLSMTGRDYPMIMAVVLTYGAFLAVMNLMVDLVYGFLDPRIRY